ncbi:MAG: aldehyde dehydrogenase family protein, partial [Thermoplasmatales archaeon]|nr:aldehyde dehydrogenase family protein [Thermoplasmatales archaeon]
MKLLIDGQWSDAENNETLNKYNPATGKIMGTFPSASRKDVDRAIDAAETSFEKWGEMGSVARSKIIYRGK